MSAAVRVRGAYAISACARALVFSSLKSLYCSPHGYRYIHSEENFYSHLNPPTLAPQLTINTTSHYGDRRMSNVDYSPQERALFSVASIVVFLYIKIKGKLKQLNLIFSFVNIRNYLV